VFTEYELAAKYLVSRSNSLRASSGPRARHQPVIPVANNVITNIINTGTALYRHLPRLLAV